MKPLIKLAEGIDRFSHRTGTIVSWLALAMILIGAFNALARTLARDFGVDLSSNAFIELQWYMFSVLFLAGAAYTLKHGAHVRVDVLYGQLPSKGKVWINLVGAVIFLIPFSVLMIWVSWSSVVNSWTVLEQSPDPGGLPRYPIKTLVPIAFVLLIVQGISEIIKNIAKLRGYLPLDEVEPQEVEVI